MIDEYSKKEEKVSTNLQNLEQEELAYLSEEGKEEAKKKNKKTKEDRKKEKDCRNFLTTKKDEMKNSKPRKAFDKILNEIQKELLNTTEQNPGAQKTGASGSSITTVSIPINGGLGYRNTPVMQNVSTDTSSLPQNDEPFIFTKVLVATALFGAKIPDAMFEAQDTIYARAMYELWKKTWQSREGNGENALETFTQNVFTFGWGAMRTYPKRIEHLQHDVPRIMFDDVYRVSLRPERTWVGVGHHNGDYWSQTEFMYEEDISYDTFVHLFPEAKKKANKKKLKFADAQTDTDDDTNKVSFVTITNYEDGLSNRFIKACGDFIIYDGVLLSDNGFPTITTANCFVRNQQDPYGVGLWELGRGSDKVANHLRHMNNQQIEAEIQPLLFGASIGNGEMSYRRGPNIMNAKQPGTDIDVVRTTGNVAMGMSVVKHELNMLDGITGINDVVSGLGSESTLGATVLAKEAALNRLMLPRNSVIRALERDADVCIGFIEQTYPQPYIFVPKDDKEAELFVKFNKKRYFTEEIEYEGQQVILASQKISINFDFNLDSLNEDEEIAAEEEMELNGMQIQEASPARVVSRQQLFEILDTLSETFNMSRVIDIQIDPNSLLQPSQELTKQNVISLFPIVAEQADMINELAKTDPELAVVKFKQVKRLLEIHRENPYDWFPREFVDKAIAGDMLNENLVTISEQNQQIQQQEKMMDLGIGPAGADPGQGQQNEQGNPAVNPMNAAVNASVGRGARQGAEDAV